jgi:hypothetical protein
MATDIRNTTSSPSRRSFLQTAGAAALPGPALHAAQIARAGGRT